MKRFSLVVLGIASAIAGACASRAPAPSTVFYRPGALQPGEYACSIHSGVQHPEYPCQVTAASSSGEADGELWLEKLAGEVRYAGRVVPSAAGYHFEGERFCPYDECTEVIAMELRPAGIGYVAEGTDGDGPFRFTMRYVGEVGAMGWGGGAYGGGDGGYDYDTGYYGGDDYGYGGDDYGYGYGGDDYGYGGDF